MGSNYFLGNFLKVISSALLFWLTPSLLQPILLAIALFFVRDFLTFLFLSVGFFASTFLLHNFFGDKLLCSIHATPLPHFLLKTNSFKRVFCVSPYSDFVLLKF